MKAIESEALKRPIYFILLPSFFCVHFHGDHDVTGSITPREGVCAGANPVGHPNF